MWPVTEIASSRLRTRSAIRRLAQALSVAFAALLSESVPAGLRSSDPGGYDMALCVPPSCALRTRVVLRKQLGRAAVLVAGATPDTRRVFRCGEILSMPEVTLDSCGQRGNVSGMEPD